MDQEHNIKFFNGLLIIAECCEELYRNTDLLQVTREELIKLRDFIFTLYNFFHFGSFLMNHTHVSADLNLRRHIQTLSTTNQRALVRESFMQAVRGIEAGSRDRRTINSQILSASLASIIVSSQNKIPNKLKLNEIKTEQSMHVDHNTPSTNNPFCTVNSYAIHNTNTITPVVSNLSNLTLTDQFNTPSSPSTSTSPQNPTFPIPVISLPKNMQSTSNDPSFPPPSFREKLQKFQTNAQKPKALKRLNSGPRCCAFCNSFAHHINHCPTLQDVICKNCGEKGHTYKHCPNPPKQVEEDYE